MMVRFSRLVAGLFLVLFNAAHAGTIHTGDLLATVSNRVEEINPTDGTTDPFLVLPNGFYSSSALAIAPNGDLYVSAYLTGQGYHILGFHMAEGFAASWIADIPSPMTRALAFTPDGNLYGIAGGGSGGPVFSVDLAASQTHTVYQGGLLNAAFDIKSEPTGTLLITDSARVLRFNPTNAGMTVLTSGGLFQSTQGIAVNQNTGDIFVEDQVPDRLIKVDPLTGAQSLAFQGQIFNTERTIASDGGSLLYVDSPLYQLNLNTSSMTPITYAVNGFIDQLAVWNRPAINVIDIPEPSSALLCLPGLLAVTAAQRRRLRAEGSRVSSRS